MLVDAVLKHKGHEVFSVGPADAVGDAATLLHRHRIGAALVLDAKGAVAGILSERDIVRGVALQGPSCLDVPVSSLMATDIVICAPTDTIDHVMAEMTEHRIRHLPVLRDGILVGVISIGDVVKARLAEIEFEAQSLRDYIATG